MIEPELPVEGPGVPVASLGWAQAWKTALTEPNEAAYQRLVEDPRASLGRAVVWTFVATCITSLLLLGIQFLFGGMFGTADELSLLVPQEDWPALSAVGLGAMACLVPFAGVFSAMGLVLYAAILQFIAGAFGGQGTVSRLAYALAAYSAPLAILTAFLALVPLVGSCVSLPLGIYGVVLNILAVKAVNRFGWGPALMTFVAWVVIVILISVVLGLLFYRAIPWETLLNLPND